MSSLLTLHDKRRANLVDRTQFLFVAIIASNFFLYSTVRTVRAYVSRRTQEIYYLKKVPSSVNCISRRSMTTDIFADDECSPPQRHQRRGQYKSRSSAARTPNTEPVTSMIPTEETTPTIPFSFHDARHLQSIGLNSTSTLHITPRKVQSDLTGLNSFSTTVTETTEPETELGSSSQSSSSPLKLKIHQRSSTHDSSFADIMRVLDLDEESELAHAFAPTPENNVENKTPSNQAKMKKMGHTVLLDIPPPQDDNQSITNNSLAADSLAYSEDVSTLYGTGVLSTRGSIRSFTEASPRNAKKKQHHNHALSSSPMADDNQSLAAASTAADSLAHSEDVSLYGTGLLSRHYVSGSARSVTEGSVRSLTEDSLSYSVDDEKSESYYQYVTSDKKRSKKSSTGSKKPSPPKKEMSKIVTLHEEEGEDDDISNAKEKIPPIAALETLGSKASKKERQSIRSSSSQRHSSSSISSGKRSSSSSHIKYKSTASEDVALSSPSQYAKERVRRTVSLSSTEEETRKSRHRRSASTSSATKSRRRSDLDRESKECPTFYNPWWMCGLADALLSKNAS